MTKLFWLTCALMARLKPFFQNNPGQQCVDDRQVLSGIIFLIRNGLHWCDVPREYEPLKIFYTCWSRWSG